MMRYTLTLISATHMLQMLRTSFSCHPSSGVALTLVSQYDISIFQSIESYVGTHMSVYDVNERDVLDGLKRVNGAKRMAKIRLEEFELTSKMVSQWGGRRWQDGRHAHACSCVLQHLSSCLFHALPVVR